MLRRALILAIAVVVLLGTAEIGLRFWLAAPLNDRVERLQPTAELPRLKGLRDLVQKNQRGIFGGALYETNSDGIRDRSYDIPKPANVYRIVSIGGSNAMGSGVSEEATYAARIENVLSEASDSPIEVVNVAMAGSNIEHAVNRFEKLGLAYEPDVIVYGFAVTDIRLRDHYRSSVTREMRRKPVRSASGLGRAFELARQELPQIRRVPGTYPAEIYDNYFQNDAAWQVYLEQLDRLAVIGQENDACVLVLLQTQLDSLHPFHPYRDVYDRVAQAAADRGFTVAPSLDVFLGEAPRALWVSPTNRHAGERAHALLTDALQSGLASLPRSCWKSATPNL